MAPTCYPHIEIGYHNLTNLNEDNMKTIEEAREIIAGLAEREGHDAFAREVRAGAWDHRADVIAARDPGFKYRPLIKPQFATASDFRAQQ